MVYVKKVKTTDPRFRRRTTEILAPGTEPYSIPVPDNVVLCNGCNVNLAKTEEQAGYLVYLTKRELTADRPYDFYCESCLRRYFPKAKEVQ